MVQLMRLRNIFPILVAASIGVGLSLGPDSLKQIFGGPVSIQEDASGQQPTLVLSNLEEPPDPKAPSVTDRDVAELLRVVEQFSVELADLRAKMAFLERSQQLRTSGTTGRREEPTIDELQNASLLAIQPVAASERLKLEGQDAAFENTLLSGWSRIEAELMSDGFGRLAVDQVQCGVSACELRVRQGDVDPALVPYLLSSAEPTLSVDEVSVDDEQIVVYLNRHPG